jgi:hypothetical protein
MLRHTFVTTMLDAGVDLRDVQIAARHADPRTTMRSSPSEPGPPSELHPGRLHGVRHLTQPTSPAAHAAGDAPHCRNALVANLHIYSIPGMSNPGLFALAGG